MLTGAVRAERGAMSVEKRKLWIQAWRQRWKISETTLETGGCGGKVGDAARADRAATLAGVAGGVKCMGGKKETWGCGSRGDIDSGRGGGGG